MKRAVNYNEKKVQQGKAVLVHAGNFLQKPEEMNFHQKMERFEKLMELSEAKTKTLHLSLNFDPADKVDTARMVKIANEYMHKIGFGNQPYLVYEHKDAGHPHVHIVATLINKDGIRMNTNNLGRDTLNPARKEIEKSYGLIEAESKTIAKSLELKVDVQKVSYGKSETRRSISNVLDSVIDRYKYTSLAELNTVLKQYNVLADRGTEGSRTYKNNGLNYRLLDENGQKVGVPVKASLIHNKPTLDYIENKFKANEAARLPDIKHLKTAIDWQIKKHPGSLQEFKSGLEKEQVTVEVRRNEAGRVYGLTFIDHNKKTVFNGSDLGKEYAAKRILERLGMEHEKPTAKEKNQEQKMEAGKEQIQETPASKQRTTKTHETERQTTSSGSSTPSSGKSVSLETDKEVAAKAGSFLKDVGQIIQQAMEPEDNKGQLDAALREEEKRKKRKDQSLER